MRGPSHEHVEVRLAGGGDHGVRVLPAAEDAGPVAGEVDAGQRYPAVLVAGVPVVEELLVENHAHAVAECPGAGGRSVRSHQIGQLITRPRRIVELDLLPGRDGNRTPGRARPLRRVHPEGDRNLVLRARIGRR